MMSNLSLWPLPSWLLEAGNGALVIMMPAVLVMTLSYLWKRRAAFETFMEFYHDPPARMAMALTVFFLGTALRSLVVWTVRHFNSHAMMLKLAMGSEAIKTIGSAGFSIGTLMMVIGAACWASVATAGPLRKDQIYFIAFWAIGISMWLALWSPW